MQATEFRNKVYKLRNNQANKGINKMMTRSFTNHFTGTRLTQLHDSLKGCKFSSSFNFL